jgi:hypothetical protein
MNTHSKPTVADISGSLKVPYMAWMEHSEWPIYMTFIDHMSRTKPKVGPMGHKNKSMRGIAIGCSSSSEANGPNGDTTNGSN